MIKTLKFLFAGVLLKQDLPHSIPNWKVKMLKSDDTLASAGGKVGYAGIQKFWCFFYF